MNSFLSKKTAAGVSLIELMIALVIGTLLLIGLVQVFAASRTAYQLSTGLARVQENGRFAMDFLQRDLRMAGHLGCVNDQARFLPENITVSRPALASTFLTVPQQTAGNYAAVGSGAAPLRFDAGIRGYDALAGGAPTGAGSTITVAAIPTVAAARTAWNPAIPPELWNVISAAGNGQPVAGSDVVMLHYFNPTGAQMTLFAPGNPAIIEFTNGSNLTEGDADPGLFGISDCLNSAVFAATATNIPSNPALPGDMEVAIGGLNRSGLLGNQAFVAGQATIYRAESIAYYVGLNANGNPALYRVRFSVTPGTAAVASVRDEMVEGIESLQLQYGQDSLTAATDRPTGNIGASVLASNVTPVGDLDTAWRRVGMVQIGLVARSPDTAAAQQREAASTKLSALGVIVNPPAVNDGRYRTVYEDSIALRNRLFGN